MKRAPIRKAGLGIVVVASTVALLAGPASAHECFNASKNEHNPAAGAQLIVDESDNIVWATNGVYNRVERGLIDPDTGEGFHGIIAFEDGGEVVGSTYIVGPNDELPEQAQENGASCSGIVNIDDYFTSCLQ